MLTVVSAADAAETEFDMHAIWLFASTLAATPTHAPPTTPSAEASPPRFSASGHRVGDGVELETSLLWPAFPGLLFQLKSAIPVTRRGHLLVGVQFALPEDREDEGEFSNVAVNLGWRQYLWKGLHVDGLVNSGYGRLRDNVIDGRDYDSFDVELMALAGWRFELGRVYALVQPLGLGGVVYKSDPWPIRGRDGRPRTEGPIYVGNLLLGFQF